jgi:hypothetical protein
MADSVCYMEENVYCVGACLRDEHKYFVRAFSKRFMGVLEIAEVEAWGVKETLHWLSTTDMKNTTIEMESDYLQLVQSILTWNILMDSGP